MAYPVGIASFTLTFGAAAVLGADEPLGMRITVKASTNAIWQASGQPFLYKTQTATAALGASGHITLISPDQDGFVNSNGQGVRNWTYAVHLDYLDANNTVVGYADKNFAYLASMGNTIDLDLTIPVSTSAGVIVDIPAGGSGGPAVSDAHIIAVIAAALRATNGITTVYDATAGTITINGAGSGNAGGSTPDASSITTEIGDLLVSESGDLILFEVGTLTTSTQLNSESGDILTTELGDLITA